MKAFVTLILSTLTGLLLAEAGLRVFYSRRMSYDFEMWKYAVSFKTLVDDPRSHIHLPSREGRLMGVAVKTNSQGLRDHEYSYAKPRGVFRILAIGDSFTLGWGVPFEETFAKRLEGLLNEGARAGGPSRRYEVINMGIGNYNTEQELEAFGREGVRYHPDLVLLCFYINDAEPAQRQAANFISRNFYLPTFLGQRFFYLRSMFDRRFQYVAYYKGFYEGERWARYRDILRRFSVEARQRGVVLVPVLLPDLRDLSSCPFQAIHAKIASEFAALGNVSIDLLPAFSGKKEAELWVSRDDPHPNSKANQMIARRLHAELSQRRMGL